jgi:hypothetical protein
MPDNGEECKARTAAAAATAAAVGPEKTRQIKGSKTMASQGKDRQSREWEWQGQANYRMIGIGQIRKGKSMADNVEECKTREFLMVLPSAFQCACVSGASILGSR